MEAMLRMLGVLLVGVGEWAEMRPGYWVGCLWAKKKGSAGRFRPLDPIS